MGLMMQHQSQIFSYVYVREYRYISAVMNGIVSGVVRIPLFSSSNMNAPHLTLTRRNVSIERTLFKMASNGLLCIVCLSVSLLLSLRCCGTHIFFPGLTYFVAGVC